jgi:hypothetical protein
MDLRWRQERLVALLYGSTREHILITSIKTTGNIKSGTNNKEKKQKLAKFRKNKSRKPKKMSTLGG